VSRIATKRQWWFAFIAILIAILAPSARARENLADVLFLVTDDQRADTIAALGNGVIMTPNLDKRVQHGFAFKD